MKLNCVFLCVLPLVSALNFTYIAGYEPYSNVVQHSRIDLDQRDMEIPLKTFEWQNAFTIYNTGKNSAKSSGMRNLKGFSVNKCKLKEERYFKMFNKYWMEKGLTECEYGNDIVTAALEGKKIPGTAFTFEGKDDKFRQEVVKKSTVYLHTFMYTIWEMQDAINDCQDTGDLKNNDNSVHAWDEAVAFYTGSLEGIIQGGEAGLSSGTSVGKLLFNLAEKRCQNFGTCTGDYDGSEKTGYSQVNSNVFENFNKVKEMLYYASQTSNFKCPGIYQAKERIVSQMIVPILQGTLRYLYKTDKLVTINPSGKELGELFAFATGILPIVDKCDAKVAKKLMDRAWYGAEISFSELKKDLESTYKCLGISCQDVGALCDPSASEKGCVPYKDGAKSFDTSVCEKQEQLCDLNYYCNNWAKSNDRYCANNNYVRENCPHACQSKDRHKSCKQWVTSDKNYCQNNEYVMEYCPEACAV